MISVRVYDRWGGAGLVALGAVGSFAGLAVLTLNSETIHDLIHFAAGVLLLWAGWRATDGQALVWTRVLAAVFLVLGLAALVEPELFGLFTFGLSRLDTLLHLLYGVIGLWGAWRPVLPG
ncbi:MAG TPA: hypothetical protein VNN19_00390 [bacterium]|nr:hypothetical protein [bacterium]